MVSFQYSADQEEIQKLARKFSRDEILPAARHHDTTMEFPWKLVKKCWELGLMNGHIPTEYGGSDLNILTNCMINEELGYACTGVMTPIAVTSIGVSRI